MQLPVSMQGRPSAVDHRPTFLLGPVRGLEPQGILDLRNIACAAACASKAGFGACLARCLVSGDACDGGISNCTSV